MRARTDQARLRLDATEHGQQSLPPVLVVEPRIESLIHPARSFDREKRFEAKSGLFDLRLNLLRTMKVRSREPLEPVRRVLVNAAREVTIDDGRELRVAECTFLDTVAR